jgi:hypothetical protein
MVFSHVSSVSKLHEDDQDLSPATPLGIDQANEDGIHLTQQGNTGVNTNG